MNSSLKNHLNNNLRLPGSIDIAKRNLKKVSINSIFAIFFIIIMQI